MNKQITLSSSILSADFTNLKDQILQAEKGGIDWIHIDVMDGHFTPNITMGPMVTAACKRITSLPLDVHLMVEQPEKMIDAFIDAGASILTVHVEGNPNIHRTLQQIRSAGVKPAVAINPGTSYHALTDLLPFVDMVLVMTVNPGFSGQDFIPESLQKIAKVKAMCEELGVNPLIQVDGGIAEKTIQSAYQAGARVFVAGNAVFCHPAGIAAGIQCLRKSV